MLWVCDHFFSYSIAVSNSYTSIILTGIRTDVCWSSSDFFRCFLLFDLIVWGRSVNAGMFAYTNETELKWFIFSLANSKLNG